MIKSFIAGIFLGIAACAAALYFVPMVDQERELSMISVNPNGGNAESFHANVPMDRIMSGAPQQEEPLPAGLEWPRDQIFSDARVELFKIRNAKDAVIGVASRIAVDRNGEGDVIEWVLHLPARGSVYVSIDPDIVDGEFRVGEMLSGTREFGSLRGAVTERRVGDESGAAGGLAGRIELQTTFIAAEEDL